MRFAPSDCRIASSRRRDTNRTSVSVATFALVSNSTTPAKASRMGSVYLLVAVKRVRGMRLVGLIRQQRTAGQRAATVASHRAHQRADSSSETP